MEGEGDRKSYVAYGLATHNTDVPMSKLRLSLPKGKDVRRNKQILHFYKNMCSKIQLFQTLYDATHEYWLNGNCVPGDSQIRTPDGYVDARTIKEGDLVLTHTGKFQKVLKTASRNADELFEFNVWKTSTSLKCTGEHPIEILRNGSFDFVEAKDVTEGDYIRITWPIEEEDVNEVDLTSNRMSISGGTNFTSSDSGLTNLAFDNDMSYLVGYWLGDGTLVSDSVRSSWVINFGKGSDTQYEKVKNILVSMFGSDSIYTNTKKNHKVISIQKNTAFKEWWFNNFVETLNGKSLKRVPSWLINLPDEKLGHVIAGCIDSDGFISQSNNGFIKFRTTAKKLADFYRDACFKLGAVCNTNKIKPRPVKQPNGDSNAARIVYDVTILDKESCDKVSSKCVKKAPGGQRYSEKSNYFIRLEDGRLAYKIRKISRSNISNEVFNFEVDVDHTYQVNGFSTHNCYLFMEDHDLTNEIPEDLLSVEEEEEVGEIDYVGRVKKKSVKKRTLMPETVRSQNIRKFVQEKYQGWQRIQILPPEQIKLEVFQYTNKVRMELIPSEKDRLLVLKAQENADAETVKIAEDIPDQIRENLLSGQPIPLNSSPYDDFLCSSFCYHLAHKKAAYDDRGISLLERCLRTLVFQDKLRQAQTSIASRAMTPKRIVWADKMSEPDTDSLRDQIDQAIIDPDFTVVTNFEVHWDEIGSRDRLLDLGTEYETTNKMLYIGLRITESMLTGESTYSGEKIHLDVMNTMYLLYRERMSEFVEEWLFKPVAEKKGFWEEDEYGNRNLLYPKLQFTRLALRDNSELQDYMFNLYQKGSLPISFILDLLNIDSDDALEQLKRDMFSPNDSTFNEFLKNVLQKAGDEAIEKTDVFDRIINSINLKRVDKKSDRFGKEE